MLIFYYTIVVCILSKLYYYKSLSDFNERLELWKTKKVVKPKSKKVVKPKPKKVVKKL